jgi:GR25 family glycosyltransferase involved in LPS biosynthesis
MAIHAMRNISTFVISLDHRIDRRDECSREFEKLSGALLWEFFSAKHTPHQGLIGCALSHAMALSSYLFASDNEYVMILEDDFQIIDEMFMISELPELSKFPNWDVFLLGHNVAIPIESTPFSGTFRVINAQTTTGYIARRSFVPKLINTFFKSAELLRRNLNLSQPNQSYAKHFYALDILWKDMQIEAKFLAKIPAIVKQRPSFSDIEKKVVDYKL